MTQRNDAVDIIGRHATDAIQQMADTMYGCDFIDHNWFQLQPKVAVYQNPMWCNKIISTLMSELEVALLAPLWLWLEITTVGGIIGFCWYWLWDTQVGAIVVAVTGMDVDMVVVMTCFIYRWYRSIDVLILLKIYTSSFIYPITCYPCLRGFSPGL